MAKITIYPSDDTAANEADKDANYGTSDGLTLRNYTDIRLIDFFKFDVSAINNRNIISALFYFYVYTAAAITDVYTQKCNADWVEGTLTWNYMPGVIAGNIATYDVSTVGWKSGDITTTVQDWVNGGNNYGIRLSPNTVANLAANIYAKEKTDYKPYILVTFRDRGGFSGVGDIKIF